MDDITAPPATMFASRALVFSRIPRWQDCHHGNFVAPLTAISNSVILLA